MQKIRRAAAVFLILLLSINSVSAGITVSTADGITVSTADGINYIGTNGITASGADSFLTFGVNGITASGMDGITVSTADGITASGADGVSHSSLNGIAAANPSGITISTTDGITASGADGITVSTADGTQHRADSIIINRPNGITISTADNLTAIGTNGVARTATNGITVSTADGITASGADGITVSTADSVMLRSADGKFFSVAPNGITVSTADGITASGADGITISTADGITVSTADTVAPAGNETRQRTGLQSVDPELALLLNQVNQLTDDSHINAVIVYHQLPSAVDFSDLQRLGILGGTRFHVLPAVYVSATPAQLIAVSRLPNVRSLYRNRTLQLTADPANGTTGVERARRDADLTRHNARIPVSGRGVTVAVLDTGLDSTHGDLAGRVIQNVKLADPQSAGVGFQYPANVENLPNTDQAHGHGTFVAGVIGGNGTRSAGRYTGVAPGARLLGLSAGDLNLLFVLNGFDYLLARGASLGVRIVNCSFSANTIFDINDPVNVATRMLTERGVNVVFSAGNTGAGWHTLNPYAAAPWVVSVGATDAKGRLAGFSSRGDFASQMFRPTLVAPGVGIVGARAGGVNVTGAQGIGFNGDAGIGPLLVPFYTTASGTSFSAPQVAGTIALMLEANPTLSPAEVRDILQRTATPLPPYYSHEVGAGMLNTHAAVLETVFPERRFGNFRATLNRGQVRFVSDPVQEISGTVDPGANFETIVQMPADALVASMQIGWGALSANDLGMALYDADGRKQADVNTINLPGLTGKRERSTLDAPSPGAWRVQIRNTLGAVAPTSQQVVGALEIGRAEYAPLRDIGDLNAAERAEIYQTIRTFVMSPTGNKFRPAQAVTRGELAQALVLSGRVPQYVPAEASYRDVRDAATLLFVESVQRAPQGALFTDVQTGGSFAPNASVDRLTAAIALVRAAGLQAEAEASANLPLNVLDAGAIPAAARGYVRVALARGLLVNDGAYFRPQTSLTRINLAHAMVSMQKLFMQ